MSTYQTTQLPKDNQFCSIPGITISALLGGPLAAFYFISKNYRALNNKNKAKKSLIYGFCFTILIFIGLISLPNAITDNIVLAIENARFIGIISVLGLMKKELH